MSEPEESADEAAAEDASEPASPEPEAPDPLADARRAFEVGDYRRVRDLTEPLMEGSGELADAARALHRRTEVDSLQIGVILACVAVLVILVYTYVL